MHLAAWRVAGRVVRCVVRCLLRGASLEHAGEAAVRPLDTATLWRKLGAQDGLEGRGAVGASREQ